ncbi:MAG: class I SAM-dependent methyltransferase [Azonexus sp.]|nr:class I SAM-dependent methyltransferase [Azonexus sp.]
MAGTNNTMEDMANQEKHLYEYSVDPESHTAGAFVVEFVGTGRHVLEVGCGPGSITRVLATAQQCRVTGVELDPDAIEKVTPFCDAVIRADLNSPDWPGLVSDKAPFDVVVAADVLEHLYDPWKVIGRMARLLGPEGFLVISLPHACHAAVASCLIDGDFQYRDWGLLDRTHIRFFGLANMQTLFERGGLKIVDYRFVIKPPEETEFAASWARLPASLRRTLGNVPHADIYQVVIKAVPSDHTGTALTLKPPQHKDFVPSTRWRNRIRTGFARHLDPYPRIKGVARHLLRFLGINP